MRPITLKAFTLLLAAALVGAVAASAQTYVLGEASRIETCEGTLLDPGGARDYPASAEHTVRICPAGGGGGGDKVSLTFAWADIRRGDAVCVFDGDDPGRDPELTCSTRWTGARLLVRATAANPSGCLTVHWRSDGAEQGRGFEAEIACAPACQPIVPALAGVAPDTAGQTTIQLCPGGLIDLEATATFPQNGVAYRQDLATTEFRWELPDGRRRRGRHLLYAFANPGGYLLELHAEDARGCATTTPRRVRVEVAAPPTLVVDAALSEPLCAPATLRRSLRDGAGIAARTRTQYFAPLTSRTDSLPLPDGTGAAHESTIVISQYRDNAILTSSDQLVSVCAVMEHSWARDLSIELVSPDGRTAVLHDHPGRFGEEVFLGEPVERDAGASVPEPGVGYAYCWNDTDPKGDWLAYLRDNPATQTLPAGTYRSYDPLSVLVGSPLNGAWTLRILDHWEADNGWIFEWNLGFAADLPLAVDSFRTQIAERRWERDDAQSAYSPLDIAYAPTSPGSVTSRATFVDDFGCRYDTAVATPVLPQGHPECGPCADTRDTLPTQTVSLGDTVRFDLGAAAEPGSRYAAIGSRPFSRASHPPARPLRSDLTVLQPPTPRLGPDAAGLVEVCLDVAIGDVGELSADLLTPGGARVPLLRNHLAGRRDLRSVCFRPDAPMGLRDGDLAAAAYRPAGDWSALADAAAEGTWQLEVSDARGFLDTSYLHAWWLTFDGVAGAAIAAPADAYELGEGRFGANPAASTSYTFAYEDAQGCQRTLTYPVAVRQPCRLELEVVAEYPPACAQDPAGSVRLAVSGGQGPVRIEGAAASWSGGLATVTGLAGGVHAFTAVDSAGCVATASAELASASALGVTFAVSARGCDDDDVVVFDVTPALSDVSRVRELSWVDLPGVSPTGLRQNLPPGDYVLRVVDTEGCVSFHPVRLAPPAALAVSVETTALGCADDRSGALAITPSGGVGPYAVEWDDDGASGAIGLERSGLPAGDYAGVLRDARGCETRFAVRLTSPTPLSGSVHVEPNWCAGEASGAVAVEIAGGTGPYEIRVDGGAWRAGTLAYGLAPGEHLVEVRDRADCDWSAEVWVPTLSTLPLALDVDDREVAYGDSVRLDAAPGKHAALTRVLWRFDGAAAFACDTCAQTALAALESGVIRVMAEDTLGCRAEGTARLTVRTGAQVFVPTGFTPGRGPFGDRKLRVHGRNGTVIETFRVFDRWGSSVFEARDLRANDPRGWDGTHRGQPAEPGTYLYEVVARDRAGTRHRVSGSTTLLR